MSSTSSRRSLLSGVLTQTSFLEFLNVPNDRLLSNIPKVNRKVTPNTFVKVANTMAKSMKDLYFADEDLLVLKSTESQYHGGHVSAAGSSVNWSPITDCRPDYAAAFMNDWGGKNTTLWPCIRLVGEEASYGESREDQERQAMSNLHYLLLARPDLNVAQGFFTSGSDIMFLFGIGGVGIRTFSVEWGSKDLRKLMSAFIYRLYDPGNFADPSYVAMVPNPEKNFVTYSIRLAEVNTIINNLRPIYASNPFGTRTHILSNPESEVNVDGKPLTVLKDQLCQVEMRFDEYDVLTHVHHPEKVPGVIEAVYHEVIPIPRDFCQAREKHRLGLRQTGKPFTNIRTVGQILEIIFDTLEVLRYLRFERHVLHRDISKGNILYVEDDLPPSIGAQSDGANKTVEPEPKEQSLCFIKYILGDSNDPKKTSVLLIDFNHAERLDSKAGLEYDQTPQTGTPVFMARAVQLGGPVRPYSNFLSISEVPTSPERYSIYHPDRIRKFLYRPIITLRISTKPDQPDHQWRHELDHDTESVFWVLLYWLICAQPEGEENEPIPAYIWTSFTGPAQARTRLLRYSLNDTTHSAYEPLWSLLDRLAAILNADRHWVEQADPRNDPGYINEAFQRLILQFILDHRNEGFMRHRIDGHPRRPQQVSGYSRSTTDSGRKRSSPEQPRRSKRFQPS